MAVDLKSVELVQTVEFRKIWHRVVSVADNDSVKVTKNNNST